MTLWQWFRILISGQPHERIGGEENPYMLRWYVIPQNRWMKVFVHKFLRDDDDRAPHDHPWSFVSLVIFGSYIEWLKEPGWHPDYPRRLEPHTRRAGSICYRAAATEHRVALPRDAHGNLTPCWTFVITGSKKRQWGFHCPDKGFVPAPQFDKSGCE